MPSTDGLARRHRPEHQNRPHLSALHPSKSSSRDFEFEPQPSHFMPCKSLPWNGVFIRPTQEQRPHAPKLPGPGLLQEFSACVWHEDATTATSGQAVPGPTTTALWFHGCLPSSSHSHPRRQGPRKAKVLRPGLLRYPPVSSLLLLGWNSAESP